MPLHDKQSITRAKLRAVLLAPDMIKPRVKLHVVTDSELLFLAISRVEG